MPHADVLRSIELFGEQVIPALRGVRTGVEAPAEAGGRKRPDMRIFLRESRNVTPALLFEALPLSFRRDRADGLRAVYRIDLAGDGGGTWFVQVADGRCEVTREPNGAEPDVRIKSDAETWVELAKGNRSRMGAVLRRRLRVKGDRRKAAQFARLFS